MKKYMPVLLVSVLLASAVFAFGALFVLPGFEKRTDVYLQDFSISEDGSVITLRTALSGSMGYIRDMEAEQIGGGIHCSFYSAFGGLNSGFGAKNSFQIKVDGSVEKIYFDRGEEPDDLVLERDGAAGAWAQKRPGP